MIENDVVISHQSSVISHRWLLISRAARRLETADWGPKTTRERSEHGFTLIELVVVAGILIVLAGIGLVQYKNGKVRASEAVLKTDLFNLRDGIDQYYADKGMYPATLDELVSSGYLRKVPDDPFTMSGSTWQTLASEPDPNNPNAPPGVYDVKSGADATALDGTKYADW
jgi:general secretion pathway protein G